MRILPYKVSIIIAVLFDVSLFGSSVAFSPVTCTLCSLIPKSSTHRHTTTLQMSSTETKQQNDQNSIQMAKALISNAISVGAPAYNAGDVKGCARIYRTTALKIAPLLPALLKISLEKTITESPDGDNDQTEAAWAFRRQFDTIMEYQPSFLPVVPDDETTYILEKFTDQQLPSEPLNILDNVMGGVSQGRWESNLKTFRGYTSLANNGGFASLRWRFNTMQNWSFAKGLYLKVKHSKPQEHTFRLILKDITCEQIRGANFKSVFANPQQQISGDDDDTHTIYIPFSSFNQMEQMGRQLSGPVLNPGAVTEIGLMAIKPTVVGDFELIVEEWGLYVPKANGVSSTQTTTSSKSANADLNFPVKVKVVQGDDRFCCYEVRRKVFIEEQQVPKEIEMDGRDEEDATIHILASFEEQDGSDKPCGAARLLIADTGHEGRVGKIGRVAVNKEYRSQGIGRKIMEFSLDYLRSIGCQKAMLGAQTHAIPFYESLGFSVVDDVEEYIDAGNVPHRDMEQNLLS